MTGPEIFVNIVVTAAIAALVLYLGWHAAVRITRSALPDMTRSHAEFTVGRVLVAAAYAPFIAVPVLAVTSSIPVALGAFLVSVVALYHLLFRDG